MQKTKIIALLRLIAFIAVFGIIFMALENHFFRNLQPHPTWEYIEKSEREPIDILYVGNSHTYSSIDSAVLSEATGLNVRSLTCASINGEIAAANVEAFLNYEIPKAVVLEMCPFSVDNRETMRESKIGIVFQHFDSIPDTLVRWKAISKVANFEDMFQGTFQLLRNSEMWTRWESREVGEGPYDEYGALRLYGIFNDTQFDAEKVEKQYLEYTPTEEDVCMVDHNRIALKNVLALSEKYGFEVWIYNAPIAVFDPMYANAMSYVYSLQEQGAAIKYIDNSMTALQEIGITRTDYLDTGHLNANGMEKTTEWMLEKIADRFQVDVDTSKIARYHDATIQMLDEDEYRYEINAYGDALYQFEYKDASGNEVSTGYSQQNWLEENALETGKLFVSMKSPKTEEVERCSFLQYTIKGYTVTVKDNTMTIENGSNFADDLMYSWEVENTSGGAVEEYEEGIKNKVSLTFEESGEYWVHAHTIQDEIDRKDTILTLTYDADSKKITVLETLDCVKVK